MKYKELPGRRKSTAKTESLGSAGLVQGTNCEQFYILWGSILRGSIGDLFLRKGEKGSGRQYDMPQRWLHLNFQDL